MSIRVSKFVIIGIAAVAFAIGIFASPAITGGFEPFARGPDQGKVTGELNEQIEKLSKEIDQLKNNSNDSIISGLEERIKSLDDKLDDMRALSGELERLKDEVEKLKGSSPGPQTQQLAGSLDKSEYSAGESMRVTGTGAPNSSVRVSVFDSNNSVVSSGSVTSDSSGRYSFTVQLPNFLASGNYKVSISQGTETVERTFRISSAIINSPPTTGGPNEKSIQGLSLRTDKEYLRGETVQLSGTTDPDTFVDFEIFDPSDVPLVVMATKSDSSGNFKHNEYRIEPNAPLGVYEVKATVGAINSATKKEVTVSFSVVTSKSSSSSPPPTSSGSLTVKTDKDTYSRGNFVKVSGKGSPNANVMFKVDVPTGGDDLVFSDTADSAGNYDTLFSINSGSPTGKWKITATQGTSTATTDIIVI